VTFLIGFSLAQLAILPVLVFLAETCVVTLSTVRTICITRGRKCLAATLGFFEVSIWLFAIGQIMQNLTDLGCYLAFASGFSVGNFLGVLIEKKLALGDVVVQITTKKNTAELVENLRAANFGVTTLDARGSTGPVQVVLTVIKRKQLQNVVAIIKNFDVKAFFAVNDLQSAAAGIFPAPTERAQSAVPKVLGLLFPAAWLERKAENNAAPLFAAMQAEQIQPALQPMAPVGAAGK
jgi:uncharacterized protein YebE (UPF0316 family)